MSALRRGILWKLSGTVCALAGCVWMIADPQTGGVPLLLSWALWAVLDTIGGAVWRRGDKGK